MKELEYKLLFNVQISETKLQIPSYEKAILSFLKEVKRTSVKIKQVCDIQTKLNIFTANSIEISTFIIFYSITF